jgi:hypothetical protein
LNGIRNLAYGSQTDSTATRERTTPRNELGIVQPDLYAIRLTCLQVLRDDANVGGAQAEEGFSLNWVRAEVNDEFIVDEEVAFPGYAKPDFPISIFIWSEVGGVLETIEIRFFIQRRKERKSGTRSQQSSLTLVPSYGLCQLPPHDQNTASYHTICQKAVRSKSLSAPGAFFQLFIPIRFSVKKCIGWRLIPKFKQGSWLSITLCNIGIEQRQILV